MIEPIQQHRFTRSATHYNKLRKKLPTGPVQRERAKNTEINIDGVWQKWTRYTKPFEHSLIHVY